MDTPENSAKTEKVIGLIDRVIQPIQKPSTENEAQKDQPHRALPLPAPAFPFGLPRLIIN
jgi:hypothetical protein